MFPATEDSFLNLCFSGCGPEDHGPISCAFGPYFGRSCLALSNDNLSATVFGPTFIVYKSIIT